MKAHFIGLAIALLLVVGSVMRGHAEDAATPVTPTAPAVTAPPPSVPRPALLPKTAEPALPPAADESAAVHHRRIVQHHVRRYGYDRTAFWEPFPIYWPHIYHNRVRWNRIPWLIHF